MTEPTYSGPGLTHGRDGRVIRAQRLLTLAADEFDRASDPFAHQWLDEHDVTLDECIGLSEGVAMAIRVYLVLKMAYPVIWGQIVTQVALAQAKAEIAAQDAEDANEEGM